KTIDSIVALLQTNPNVRRIQVNGYADTTGGAEANMELSNKRTDTVSNYITGKGLMKFKVKFASAFFGEKVTGKEADLSEMRRVDVVLYMARPDRDTTISVGCASVKIKANTFENYNNDELVFNILYVENAEDMKKNNLSNLDNEGNKLLSGGMFKVSATYKGKPVKGVLPIEMQLPIANKMTGYSLYTGIEEKGKQITWKLGDLKVADNRNNYKLEDKECYTAYVNSINLNTWYNAAQKYPCNYCNADPFGGLETPDKDNQYAKFGVDQSIVILNDGNFKKMDATKTYFQIQDDLYPETFLDFCTSLKLPGVGDIPAIPKYETELVKFIDFNVSMKNDTADLIMVKKSKVTILIPKSKFPEHTGKQYALLPADTKKDDFFNWTNKLVINDPCQGLANCDYWVFEVPFSGFYSLLEVTPAERKTGKGKSDEESADEPAPKYVTVKCKKFNNVMLIYGDKSENKATTATFVKNKGKHSINQPSITKKEKKSYKNHIFLAYVVINGKRYAWIGKGSDLKTNIFTGNWKTPKLKYIPDDEWDDFIRKACE
ncbi:MAG: OmpA family protein, partial [Bacteroidetes bacterium]|nr:OmpA family protein [Bacteroidota bacterium]